MRYFNVYSFDGLKFFGSVVVEAKGDDNEIKKRAWRVAVEKTRSIDVTLTPSVRKVHANWALNRL